MVAIDIDGTLGDYHGHFLRFARDYLGLERNGLRCYQGEPGFRDWFCAAFDVDERTWYDIKLAYRQGAQKRSMPLYAYAANLTTAVIAAGAELWLTTTRPYLRLDNVDPDTRAWLVRHRIAYDRLLYDEEKYSVLAGLVDPERVVAVLEDEPEQYAVAAAAFGADVPILRRQKYNMAVSPGLRYVTDLHAAGTAITSRIYDWKEKH